MAGVTEGSVDRRGKVELVLRECERGSYDQADNNQREQSDRCPDEES